MDLSIKGRLLATAAAVALAPAGANATTLFFDDFNGSSLDTAQWRLPTGPGTFFGRTQIKPPSFGGLDLSPVVSGGTVTLQLDTHNASDPNDNSFWGHEIQTFQQFTPGANGISIKTRMRFKGIVPGGLVGGFFTWGFDGAIRDEIDFELLTNALFGDAVHSNVYNDATFADPGLFTATNVPGFDMIQWNDYEIQWLPDRIKWFVNGNEIREEIITVAGHPSEVRLNIWAPDPGFFAAYNAALQPTDGGSNGEYELEIDFVEVSTVPVPPAILLFSSGLAVIGWLRRRGAAR